MRVEVIIMYGQSQIYTHTSTRAQRMSININKTFDIPSSYWNEVKLKRKLDPILTHIQFTLYIYP